ncbi:MAG: sigma-70 family RNA polymerase sigma factor [Candidatus Binatia bacterium]
MLSSDDLKHLVIESRTDPEAADRLLALYRPVLKLIAEQMVGPVLQRREDASDIVQRTELEAYAAFEQFQGASEAEFSGWLKQILRRNITNLVRDNRAAKRDVRREQYLDAAEGSVSVTWMQPAGRGTTPSQRLIKAENAVNLARALDELPEQQATAVRMRHLEGRGIDEIAASMNKTPAATAGLLRRGMQALRERMPKKSSWL